MINTIKVENHRCKACKKYFYSHKSLLKHKKCCKEIPAITTQCSNNDPQPLKSDSSSYSGITALYPNDTHTDKFKNKPPPLCLNDKKYDLDKPVVIEGVNLKLFKIKEKLFDIVQFIMFEQCIETTPEIEKIYRNVYKSISKCISNVLIEEQEVLSNNSLPDSPQSLNSVVQTSFIRRGSWSSH